MVNRTVYESLLLLLKVKTEVDRDEEIYGICLGCNHFVPWYCEAEELLRFPYVPRKTSCKYFEEIEPDFDKYDVEEYLEGIGNRT